MSSTVLVTGASGFVAKHIVQQLLEAGYRVRGTVRSQSKADDVRDVMPEDAQHRLDFVEADLSKDDGWEEAAAGCTYVMHTASPFFASVGVADDVFVRPAVDGTRRVLKAAANNDIERVVMTSSTAAVSGGHSAGTVLTEEHWTDVETAVPYTKSKTLAERAAWDFVAGAPDLELTVINPSAVLGPVLDAHTSYSHQMISVIMRGEYPMIPRIGFTVVDVRDVAKAHLLAMTNSDAPGQRFICTSGNRWMIDIARLLKSVCGPQGYRISTRPAPDFLIKIYALFDDRARDAVTRLGQETLYSTAQIREVLGWHPRDVDQTILDTAESLIKHGVV